MKPNEAKQGTRSDKDTSSCRVYHTRDRGEMNLVRPENEVHPESEAMKLKNMGVTSEQLK